MNEHFDPLEAELASLKPRDPSPDLKQRIANQVAAVQLPGWLWVAQRTTARTAIGFSLAAALAACALAALVLNHSDRPAMEQPTSEFLPPIAAAFDDALPTVWTYQRALSGSPSELEALLDKHASLAPPSADHSPTHLFIRSDRNLLLQGEL